MTEEGSNQKHDFLFKVVMLGDHGVGKTQLVSRYVANEFTINSTATLGVEFTTKTIKIDGKLIGAQIWDTAGQEKYKSLTRIYYKGAVGAILVYDITRKDSFEKIRGQWFKELKNFTAIDIVGMLIGNKCDLEDRREVTISEATNFAKDNGKVYLNTFIGLAFMETSAKDATNVDVAFERIFTEIYELSAKDTPKTKSKSRDVSKGYKISYPDDTIRLNNAKEKRNKNCC